MGITILIVFALCITGAIVWFFLKNKKEEPSVQPEKPSEPVSQPSNPPVGEVPKGDEKEPEKPKQEFMPKFKVGDLVVTDYCMGRVVEITSDAYLLDTGQGIPFSCEHNAHIWNITKDAKDGDVLCCESGWTCIFKALNSDISFSSYCFMDDTGWFCETGSESHTLNKAFIKAYNGNIYPATKEQCDILFRKMKESGYEWDADKKELKKIEDAPKPPVVDEKPKYDEDFEGYLNKYSQFAKIERDSYTYKWFFDLYKEARAQLHHGSCNMLPILLKQENFPTLYEWGDKGDAQKAQDTMIGWLFSLQLAELKPYYRADIFQIGYEMGGYDRYSNIYGYKFELDPNVMRLLASTIYPAMKGYCKPVTETLRREVEGTRYNSTLQQLYDNNSRDNVAPNAFFTDFRVFMPTAPAPYAPVYSKRGDRTYPNEERDEFDNLKVDRQIHEMIVEAYNLNQPEHYQEVVQAIADKEVEAKHLFGKNRETKNFKFHPVFGDDTIGIELPDERTLASFAYLAFRTGSSSRGIMQSATVNPVQYGRLRPGCSWNQEAKKNSSTDDRRNILTNFEIEDGDGSPTGYYDANGNWVYMDNIHNPEEYEEYQKNALYANSYPSGHSSGIFCSAMLLMELLPNKADLILKAANQYAVNRTIARYHWTSDTINGRVLGSATNAICHAASDYYAMLDKIKKEL